MTRSEGETSAPYQQHQQLLCGWFWYWYF